MAAERERQRSRQATPSRSGSAHVDACGDRRGAAERRPGVLLHGGGLGLLDRLPDHGPELLGVFVRVHCNRVLHGGLDELVLELVGSAKADSSYRAVKFTVEG